MALIRSGEELATDVRKPQGRFTGDADQRLLHVREGGDAIRVSFVHFHPGSRTYWHSHSGGQVIHVVEGEAEFRERGADRVRLQAGDTARTEAGVEHWHGAAEGGPMTHLVVTIGEVSWGDPPD